MKELLNFLGASVLMMALTLGLGSACETRSFLTLRHMYDGNVHVLLAYPDYHELAEKVLCCLSCPLYDPVRLSEVLACIEMPWKVA